MSTPTLLVLGCGTVGQGVVRWLAGRSTFARFLVADRDEARARYTATLAPGRAQPVAIDMADRPALVRLMRQASVVLNCVGPFYRWGRPAVEAALEAGTPYVDINDDASSVEDLFSDPALDAQARHNRQVVLVGTGTSPGVTNMLARLGAEGMERVERITFALASAVAFRGQAVMEHFIHVLSHPARVYRNGRLVDLPPFSEPETFTFLEVEEPILCYAAGHPEPITVPRFLPGVREVVMKFGRVPNALLEAFHTLYRYGLMDSQPIPVGGAQVSPAQFLGAFLASDTADRVFGFSRTRPLSARVVRVEGIAQGRRVEVTLRYTSPYVTAQAAALTAEAVAQGRIPRYGLVGPEVLDARPLLRELLKEGGSFRMERRVVAEGLDENT
ncbi:MAG: saccharopine dehydrogenase NADP-binding domain-containing protein [Dehalococcoidia bacterium]|nr:saccharopine dehydrogenase NADP-binding domain-containing protein [Dehalococcoidia bacterium]MDW8120664.1 saccharopine dehydrogenase NADP-binding domain-containing protein [Chloroflexota bacterium]